nr:hypothetical protein [uncultured Undibacterium sp.]
MTPPPSQSEVDYSINLITMLVLNFESWISRARFFQSTSKLDKYVTGWINGLNDSNLIEIKESLEEVYFLRDAICHNHIWTYNQIWEGDKVSYINFDFNLVWQGTKGNFDKLLDCTLPSPRLPRTRKMRLNIVPCFIGRQDVLIVFKVVKRALFLLDSKGHLSFVSKSPNVQFGDKLSFPFWDLENILT